VTGGEPLAQRNCISLLAALCDARLAVSLETSGALDASRVDARVARVIDVKTPGSGESARHLDLAVHRLRPSDQLKFVVCDRADYEWSRARVQGESLAARCRVLFSPSHGQLKPAQLADWILEDRLPVRLQVQLHKVLWGDVPGR
jgi:7-carboxy-7-deazaguanine synthase